jgi:hypothetical protein
LQSILKAANKLVFMITENQYVGGLEGSIPVLVQAVSHNDSHTCEALTAATGD